MDRLIALTLDRLELGDAARGVWDALVVEFTRALRGADHTLLLAAAEDAARGLGMSRGTSIDELLEGYTIGCDAIGRELGTRTEPELRQAAGRLAELRPLVMRCLSAGYAAGLEDTIERLERQAAAASPVDDFSGAMKPGEIAGKLAMEVLRCQRMDLSLGVVDLGVEVAGEEGVVCRREHLAEAQREVGECLRDGLRRYDSVGLTRDGGFLVVLPDVSRRGLAAAAERLRRQISESVGETPRLVLALAHYDYVDVSAPDVMTSLERSLQEAREQGKSVAWAA